MYSHAGRISGQRFQTGKEYVDPRIPVQLKRLTETFTLLDGDHAQDLARRGTGAVEVHDCSLLLPGSEMHVVDQKEGRLRRKLVVFEIWECIGN